jgi:hypothetical protein
MLARGIQKKRTAAHGPVAGRQFPSRSVILETSQCPDPAISTECLAAPARVEGEQFYTDTLEPYGYSYASTVNG